MMTKGSLPCGGFDWLYWQKKCDDMAWIEKKKKLLIPYSHIDQAEYLRIKRLEEKRKKKHGRK